MDTTNPQRRHTVPSREPPRDMTRQSSHEPSRTTGREAGRDAGRETGRESTYQDYTILGNGIEDEDVESVSMSSSYSGEWCRLFGRGGYFRTLQSYATKGRLRSSRFRSVCWKLYLEVLPENQNRWLEKTREMRGKYDAYKDKLIVNPRKIAKKQDLSIDNPLSQDNTSPWNQFFMDNELRLTIKQDVVRTFPGIEFFQSDSLQNMMLDILFVYGKVNDLLCYKQGMHELLAPLIFVLHCDHQAFLHACEIESVGDVIKELLNPKYIEHDAYAMFCQIMETVEPWYVSKELSPTMMNNNLRSAQPFARLQELHPSNVIVTKLTRIQDYLLKKYDPELQQYLEQLEITPQLYGIRWVRLLFGREFTMQDLLVLWDALFADGVSFDLVDYVFVAMLLYLRDALLNSDYPTCLTTLMRYPPVGDINFFIQMAIYLREPNQQPRPPLYTYQRPAQLSNDIGWIPGATSRSNPQPRQQRSNSSLTDSMMSGWSSLTRRFTSQQSLRTQPPAVAHRTRSRPQTLSFGQQQLAKSSSEPNTLITDQSPGGAPVYHGSTTSLQSADLMSKSDVFPTGSLTTNGTSIRSCGSTASLPQLERSPTDDRMSTKSSPGTYRTYSLSTPTRHRTNTGNSKKSIPHIAQPSQTSYEVAYMLAKLSDMESMCQKCALRMDGHIESLQHEMLHQELNNEDEILLSLAGLKQVRDVLKGILKPSNLSDYGRDTQTPPHGQSNMTDQRASSSTDHTPGSQMSYGSPPDAPHPDPLRIKGQDELGTPGGSRGGFYMGSSVDTDQVSTTDSSSPEYSENIPQAQRQQINQKHGLGHPGKEIELKDFKPHKNGNYQTQATVGSIPISDETMNRYRQSFNNYPPIFPQNSSHHTGQTQSQYHQRSLSVGSQNSDSGVDANLNTRTGGTPRRRLSQEQVPNDNR